MSPAELNDLDNLPNNAAVTARMALQAAEATHEIKEFKIGDRTLYSVPAGRDIIDLEKHLDNPRRATGQFTVNDVSSFQKMIDRHANDKTLVRLCACALWINATFNDHSAECPGWRDHSMKWQLVKHRDLKAWETLFTKNGVSQLDLMEFLDDHLIDITENKGGPSQSKIQSVIADFNATTDAKFTSKRDQRSGSYVLHNSSETKPEIEVPEAFDIGVPVFEGLDIAYIINIKLRWRVNAEGKLTFLLSAPGLQAVLDEAWEAAMKPILEHLDDKGVTHITVPA